MSKTTKSIRDVLLASASINKKLELLLQEHQTISTFTDLEQMILEVEESKEEEKYKKFYSIFFATLKLILQQFRIRDILPSSSETAKILFNIIHRQPANSTQAIDILINDMYLQNLVNPAIVVFPLNAFGFQDAGLPLFFHKANLLFETKDLVLFPQQNGMENLKKSLNLAKEHFRMKSIPFEEELIDHFYRSRSLKWLIRNPLLTLKVAFSSSSHYENQYFLVRHLEKNASKLFLINTLLQQNALPSTYNGFSTRNINNFETRDIKHYLVFSRNGRLLSPACIPIQGKLSNYLELSQLNFDLPLLPSQPGLFNEITDILDTCYSESLGEPTGNKDYKWDFYDRMRRSLAFFVKSYQSRYRADEILFLGIAFEMLYADKNKSNVTQTLGLNLTSLFPNLEDMIYRDVASLYHARSGVAHEGMERETDLATGRTLYLNALLRLNKLIKSGDINPMDQKPLSEYSTKQLISKLGFNPFASVL